MSRMIFILIALVTLSLSPSVRSAESDIGIVLMHGKWDSPPTNITALARILASKGFKVVTPVMPWSSNREYDVDYPTALTEIDAAIKSLREKGAKRIIVGGHSFGANASVAYAGSGKEVDGVMALAPGHTPDRRGFRNVVASSVEKARQMIAQGRGEEKTSFDDFNQGKTKSIRTTAKNYFSFFDPDGLAVMPKNAAAIPRPIPFLLVIGTQDGLFASGEEYLFNKVPTHPKSKYLVVESNHVNNPTEAAAQIIEWIMSLGY